MRLHWVLLSALAASASAADLEKRQSGSGSITSNPPDPITDEPPPTSSSSDGGGGGGGGGGDTTITVTTTVSNAGETITRSTTKTTTRTTTIVDTSTVFETTTVTSRGQATATETAYATTTVFRNAKRWYDPAPHVAVQAFPTPTPAPGSLEAKRAEIGPNIVKRATITVTETVTTGGDAVTVIATIMQTVVSAATSKTTTTSMITQTEQADASTTVTITSTLTVTSAVVTTGVIATETGTAPPPTETQGGENGGGSGGGGSGGGGSSGLSDGAKAGIGAGAGAVGLVIIGALVWFFFKRRRGPKYEHDDHFGASEVPVGAGPTGGGTLPDMSNIPPTSGGAYIPPSRSPIPQSRINEGYRGTAMGDGRAGYAKPEPYGAAYTRTSTHPPSSASPVSPSAYTSPSTYPSMRTANGDHLPEHSTPAGMDQPYSPQASELGNEGATAKWSNPDAAEMDSTPMTHQSGPVPQNVFEMPAQQYR